MTGAYNSFFRMFDRETGRGVTLEAWRESSKPRAVLRTRRVYTGGKRRRGDVGVDSLDFTKKILHMAWHPSENIIAIAATNNLYIFQDRVNPDTQTQWWGDGQQFFTHWHRYYYKKSLDIRKHCVRRLSKKPSCFFNIRQPQLFDTNFDCSWDDCRLLVCLQEEDFCFFIFCPTHKDEVIPAARLWFSPTIPSFLKMFVELPWCSGCEWGAGTPPHLQRPAALFTDNSGRQEWKTHTWQHQRIKHKDKHSDAGRVLLNLGEITLKANIKIIRSFVQLFATSNIFWGFSFGWPQHLNLFCRAALLEMACAHNPYSLPRSLCNNSTRTECSSIPALKHELFLNRVTLFTVL